MANEATIKFVADILADPDNGDKTAEDISAAVIDALHAAHRATMKEAPPVLREGLAFRVPWSPNILHVAYLKDDLMWVTWGGTKHGWLGSPSAKHWEVRTESRGTKGGAAPNKAGHQVGQRLTAGINQPKVKYLIVATTEDSVLLHNATYGYASEPNDVLKKHFHKT